MGFAINIISIQAVRDSNVPVSGSASVLGRFGQFRGWIIRLFLLAGFLLSFSAPTLAQTDSCSYSVKGKVLDVETREPIPYANVQVPGSDKSTLTNLKGEFMIDGLCDASNTVKVSSIGYCDSTCSHDHSHGDFPHIYLEQEVLKLETVTISAQQDKKEGTQTISQVTLGAAELGVNPTRSLAAAIAEEEGVSFTSAGVNVQLPVIHGLYGNRVLVLNNGLKHGFQNWGAKHAAEIDLASASRVTVLKGAAGVRFGPEALGGAVIVESDLLYLRKPLQVGVGAGYQTNGRGLNSTVKVAEGRDKWSYFLNASMTKIGDRHSPDYQLTNTGKEERSIGFGTRYSSGNWDAKLYYSYVDQDLALLRASFAHSGNALVQAVNSDEPLIIQPFSYDINEPNQVTQHHLGKAEVSWRQEAIGKITFRAGRQWNDRQEFDVRRNAELPIIDLSLTTTDYQLEWKHKNWQNLNGLMGVQYFSQNNDNNPGTGTTPFIPNYNTDRYSAFLIESRSFGKNTIEAGIRVDAETNNVRGRETNQDVFRDEYQFTNFTSSLGFVRELSENSTFRSNIGTAWRTPNMAELYSFGQHGFKTQFGLLRYYYNEEGALKTNRVSELSDSEIEPEKGYKFINEFRQSKGRTTHTLTAYAHYIENFIFDRPHAVIGTIRGPMPVFVFDQADAVFVGFDYSWKRNWTLEHSGTLGISYLWSKNVSDNEALINQPPIAVNYKWEWEQGKLWWFTSSKFMARPRYTFQQFDAPRTVHPQDLIDGTEVITAESEIFDFKDAPDGYFLLDLGWNLSWDNWSAGVSVNNVLNTRYRDYLNDMRYFADELGRNVLFTLNYQFSANRP